MTSVLSGDLNHGITLSTSGAYTAPFTITQTGSLGGAAYSNLSGAASPFLENLGFAESVIFTNGGTIQNSGTIDNAGLGYGILMRSGNASITNSGSQSFIYGGNYGIAILSGTADITNAGHIGGLAGAAVKIATGTVINKAGASIYAHEIGLKILNNGGQIQNAGAITGNQYGVFMNGGTVTNSGSMSGQLGALFDFSANATVTNSGILEQENSPFGTAVKLFGGTLDNTGFIYGATGLYLANAGTVFNAGTISAERDAIVFGGNQASRLIIAPGAVFIGDVLANQAAGNTMELTAGQSTLSGIGDIFSGFETIAFDSGADWRVNGQASGFAGDTLTGFTTLDTLDISGFSLAGTTYLTLSAENVLSISSGLALTFSAANAGEYFALTSEGHGGELLAAFTGTPPINGHAVTLQAGETKISHAINTLGLIGMYNMKDGTAAAVGAAVLDNFISTTVTNSSTIQSDGNSQFDAGIVLTGASTFINAGTIMGASGIAVLGNSRNAFIESTKDLAATLGAGIYLQQYGSALNLGSLAAATDGILLASGGYAYNTGKITAQTGILAEGPNSYIYNAGLISASSIGIAVTDGGTIAEFGTLIGGQFAASFAAGAPNRFVMNSSSDIVGDVSGGGGVLELAAGKTTGTIALSQFEDFATIQIDAKSKWDFSGAFTTSAALVNNGDITLTKSAKASFDGAVSGTGTISLAANPLTFGGAVAAAQKVDFSGTHETLVLADPTAFAATIGGFAPADTIDITGISLSAVTGTAFAKNVLTITEAGEKIHLTFASASSLGSDTFLLTKAGNGFDITVSKPAKMAVLKPAGHAAAAAAAAVLPELTAATLIPPPPTYITPAAVPGIISTFLTPTSASPVLITLQS